MWSFVTTCVDSIDLTYFFAVMIWREDFRQTYKKDHPNNKSVAAVSVNFFTMGFSCCILMMNL